MVNGNEIANENDKVISPERTVRMFGIIEKIDKGILLFTQNKIRFRQLSRFMRCITKLGDYGFIWIILSIGFLFSHSKRKVGFLSVISLVVCYVINNLIMKNIIRRKRPFNKYHEIKRLVSKPRDYSFPSGHTCGSFATAGIFYRYLPGRYGKLSLVLATLIGYSRIYVGVHYPSDVIVGALIGVAGSQSIYWIDTYLL